MAKSWLKKGGMGFNDTHYRGRQSDRGLISQPSLVRFTMALIHIVQLIPPHLWATEWCTERERANENKREEERGNVVEIDKETEVTEKEGKCWKYQTEDIIYQNYSKDLPCTPSASVTHTHMHTHWSKQEPSKLPDQCKGVCVCGSEYVRDKKKKLWTLQ